MGAYLRTFAMASLLAVLLIAGLVGGYFRSTVGKNLQTLAAARQEDQLHYFIESVWLPYAGTLKSSAGELPLALRRRAEAFAQTNSVAGMRLYTPQGLLLWGTGGALSAEQFQQALHQPSRVITAADTQLEGISPSETLLEQVLPVPGAAHPEAYAEMFLDITPQWRHLAVQQWIASGGVLVVFAMLVWMLLLTSRKAEAIIARQHEANMELAAAAAAAEAENRDKSLFLANISHELRTPLNAIIGFSEIIKNEMMGEIKNPVYQGYITDIHSSGVHLLSLINDILDFSKAAAGKLEIEIEEVNASKMVANCLRLVSPRAESGGVDLINAMPREPLILETDAKKFKQIMLNLLSNAVKFTPSGGRVRVCGWRDLAENALMFEVADTGIGIAPKDIAKAMSAFGQVDNTLSRKYEGTGLGLPLTRRFVELMGGKFSIESRMNVGTTIVFSLPCVFKPRGEDVIVKRVG